MKIQYIGILLIVLQTNFCFANRASFQDPLSYSSSRKTSEILQFSNTKTKEKGIIKVSSQNMSNNYVNSTKTPMSTIINPFNVCLLLLFIMFYIIFVCIIQLVQKHYMELE